MARVRILDVTIPRSLTKAFLVLSKNKLTDISQRMSIRMKIALFLHLGRVVEATLATTPLKKRRGILQKRLRAGRRVFGGNFETFRAIVIGSEWIAAHEFGATILPKQAQKLAIPMKAALRADGSPRFRRPTSWRRFGSFIYTNSKGNLFIVMKRGSEWIWLYSLVDKSILKRQLGLGKTWNNMLGLLIAEWGSIMAQEMVATNIMAIPGDEAAARRTAKSRIRKAAFIGIASRGLRISQLTTRRR